MDEADEIGDSSDPPKRFVRIVKKSARDVVQKFLQQLTKEKELNETEHMSEFSKNEVKDSSMKRIFLTSKISRFRIFCV